MDVNNQKESVTAHPATRTRYGQIIIGPPGSGKTTYCNGVHHFFEAIHRPSVAIVNLDPANENVSEHCDINITDLIQVDDVMSNLSLGPNGALVYCLQYLNSHFEWLQHKIAHHASSYFIFDLPGQVELYTTDTSLLEIVEKLQKQFDFRLCTVHLVDAHYCTDKYKFISVVFLSLSAMIRLELPHLNILSKVDLIEQYGTLDFSLEFYTDVLDLSYLLMDENENEGTTTALKQRRFKQLNHHMIEFIQDYNLVRFYPLDIQDGKMVQSVVNEIDSIIGGNVRASSTIDSKAIACDTDREHAELRQQLQEQLECSKNI